MNKSGVEYLLIGGYAVGYYGYVRATGDIDLWIAQNQENAHRLVAALMDFGFGSGEVSAEALLEPGKMFRMGRTPLCIEFLTLIPGVFFDQCWPRRVSAVIEGTTVPIISFDDLKNNKKACNRTKDLLDFEKLEQITPPSL